MPDAHGRARLLLDGRYGRPVCNGRGKLFRWMVPFSSHKTGPHNFSAPAQRRAPRGNTHLREHVAHLTFSFAAAAFFVASSSATVPPKNETIMYIISITIWMLSFFSSRRSSTFDITIAPPSCA